LELVFKADFLDFDDPVFDCRVDERIKDYNFVFADAGRVTSL